MASTLPKRVPIPKNGVDYRGKIVLAPMVRSGELPSRLMALRYDCDLVWGPETIDRAMIGTTARENPRTKVIEFTRVPSSKLDKPASEQTESIIYKIYPSRESTKLIYQIGTANPDYAVQAALLVAPYVAGIDVNSGCPKPFSTSGGMGAALMSTPDLLCEILRRLVVDVGEKHEIGISVKIRLFPEPEDTRALVERLVRTGITGLTIHCRTRAMRKTERAVRVQLRMVADICREAGVACLMNGDVENREQAEELVKEFGVDGAMIATAAEKNPSVFRPKANGGVAPWDEVVRGYVEEAIATENRWGNTKFLLAQMIPGKVDAGRRLSQMKNYEDICRMLGHEDLVEKAKELDERLDLVNRLTKSEQKAQNGNKRKDVHDSNAQHKSTKKQKQQQQQQPQSKAEENVVEQKSDFHVDLQHDIVAPTVSV